jgi:hypothetical protein
LTDLGEHFTVGRMTKVALLLFALVISTAAKADDHAAKVSNFVMWARLAKGDKTRQGGPRDALMFNKCIEAYDAAIKAGVPPSEPTKAADLPGTLEEVRKTWCDTGKAEFEGKDDKRTAPYKKALKNDKLSMWQKYSSSLILPNGGDAVNPDKLAAANVWFVDTSPQKVCLNGGAQVHTVHRYEFNRDQKLTKTTDEDFCGRPPAAAYKK